MPAIVNKLGPGTVRIGATGTEVDFECQVTAAHVDWSEDAEDAVTVLCGDSVPGSRTYEASFAGTVLQDLSAAAGDGPGGVHLDPQGGTGPVPVRPVHRGRETG